MTLPTQPLRDEHQELWPHIESLRIVADSIGTAQAAAVQQGVEEAYQFLTGHLLPHAQAEERVLYPLVGKLMGAPEATATMSRDHTAIGQFIEELGELRSSLAKTALREEQEKALRQVLYGLSAFVTVHLAKEEEVYLPLLDARLTSREVQNMYEAMEGAAQQAKEAAQQKAL
jgi:iron-sulfur cluster repair protein YtfE (RIC family)